MYLYPSIYAHKKTIDELPAAANLPFTARLVEFWRPAMGLPVLMLKFGIIADLLGGLLRLIIDALRRRSVRGPLTS